MRVRNFMFAGHVYDCPALLCKWRIGV